MKNRNSCPTESGKASAKYQHENPSLKNIHLEGAGASMTNLDIVPSKRLDGEFNITGLAGCSYVEMLLMIILTGRNKNRQAQQQSCGQASQHSRQVGTQRRTHGDI